MIFKDIPSKYRSLVLLSSVVFGLLLMAIFSGKSHIDLVSIAVSQNEQYIAYFENGSDLRIRCICSDGLLSFDYAVSSDISAGGYCSLWFEGNELCALFYRTDKIVHFGMDGSVLEIVDNFTGEIPPKYPSFSEEGHKYVYDGNKVDIIYDKRSFVDYWLFDEERYLSIISSNGEEKIVYAWAAKNSTRGRLMRK